MTALKIISTVFVGFSCITTFIKNVAVFRIDDNHFKEKAIFATTFYGWLWRALVITTIWIA